MYTRALAQEETVRVALAAPDAAPSVLADARAVVAAYVFLYVQPAEKPEGDIEAARAGGPVPPGVD